MRGSATEPMFQHTAARRRLGGSVGQQLASREVSTHSRPKAAGQYESMSTEEKMFQHTAARRRLVADNYDVLRLVMFQHTAARRRLALTSPAIPILQSVSTHSRPKAAGSIPSKSRANPPCFNTQPPEGGWRADLPLALYKEVSTHSRPKAAG